MAELVDAPDLGSGAERCGGSSPPFRTRCNRQKAYEVADHRVKIALDIKSIKKQLIGQEF